MTGDMFQDLRGCMYNVIPYQSSKRDQHMLFGTSTLIQFTVMRVYLTYCDVLHELIELVCSGCLIELQQLLELRVVCYFIKPGRLRPCEKTNDQYLSMSHTRRLLSDIPLSMSCSAFFMGK